MGNIKNGKFVYKNEDGMNKMHEFYDKTLAALDVPYTEDYFDISFGKTHCLLVGDPYRNISSKKDEYGLWIKEVLDHYKEDRISFFPAGRVFNKAGKIFAGPVTMVEIDSKHLPSDETMVDVCKRTIEFFENT